MDFELKVLSEDNCCEAICENDVPSKCEPLHYIYRFITRGNPWPYVHMG